MEVPIYTKSIRDRMASLPSAYKVDIACIKNKIAIEVDGDTHKTKKWKFLDKRKTEALNMLGWKVLRFWNGEILNELEMVIQKIQPYIILK